MKHLLLHLLSYSLITSLFINATNTNQEASNTIQNKKIANKPEKLLRHVVLFNFNDTADAEMIKTIEREFAELKNKISEIHSFEWGINNSPEGLDKGLTHCFLVTFLSEEARATYLPHPDHQAFVKLITPYIEDVTVIDYWTQ